MLHNNFLQIPCVYCGQINSYPKHYIINASLQPELKKAILNNHIFIYECDNCHQLTSYYYPLIYFDPDHRLFMGFGSSADEFSHVVSLMRQGGKLKHFSIRFTRSYETFKETIRLFDARRDDRVIALYKNTILEKFKQKHPEYRNTVAFYENSNGEIITLYANGKPIQSCPVDENWYNCQMKNTLLRHMLRYDTCSQITKRYLSELAAFKLSEILVRLSTEEGTIDCVVNCNDHIHIGDIACFGQHKGIVIKIFTSAIKDIKTGTPFVEEIIPYISTNERFCGNRLDTILNSVTFPQEPDMKQVFDLLERCPIFVPMREEHGLLAFETMEDHADNFSFIPIFTSLKDVSEIYGSDYTIIKDNFFALQHQQITPTDGYLLNPFSKHLLPIDYRMIKMFDELTVHQSVN